MSRGPSLIRNLIKDFHLHKNLVMFLRHLLPSVADVETRVGWVYLAGHQRTLDLRQIFLQFETNISWISHQIIMLLQTSCIARPTNNSSWWWPWWPWWPWCPPWSWLALTACQEILISDRFGLFLNVSWWIYISRALASLTGLEVEPHNNGKEYFEVGNLPLDLTNSGLIMNK